MRQHHWEKRWSKTRLRERKWVYRWQRVTSNMSIASCLTEYQSSWAGETPGKSLAVNSIVRRRSKWSRSARPRSHGKISTPWSLRLTESTSIWWTTSLLSWALRPLLARRTTWYSLASSKASTSKCYTRSISITTSSAPIARVTRLSLRKTPVLVYICLNARHAVQLSQWQRSKLVSMPLNVVKERRRVKPDE